MGSTFTAPSETAALPVADKLLHARQELQASDLSQICRKQCFCVTCLDAFCPHCCHDHHSPPLHLVIWVDIDSQAGGRLVFATHYSDGERMYPRSVRDIVATKDYAACLPRDAFCLHCSTAFSAAACPEHHDRHHGHDLPEAVLRIVDRGGRQCVRCTGSEWWFPYVEMILDDPVHDDGEHQLLPVLTAKPGKCVQCGGRYLDPLSRSTPSLCSTGCSERHERALAGRRQRREARRDARGLPRHSTF